MGDVMLLPNLYGNIVGNVCCGLTGGPGLSAGSNYSCSTTTSRNTVGLFEMATRSTGASISGENKCNPTAFLMAGCKLLEYNDLQEYADVVRSAVSMTITENGVRTGDL